LIRQFIEIDETVFGGFYFNGKTIRDFVVNDSYVDVRALNAFVLARLSRIVQHNLSALSETRERIEVDFARDYDTYLKEDTT
jgi:hypothetical protein